MLEKTAALLQQLHEEGRDHIWAYYTRNLVRPVALRADPVDVIVGNPPWITYNKTQAVIREELERQSKQRYEIWAGGRYATHQDIAGMFYARVVELYLKQGGLAGMVLPHSALQTGQYTKWRTGQWGVLSVDLGVRLPWDLERIQPNDFFPVPASTLFLARRDPGSTGLGGRAIRWQGTAGDAISHDEVTLTDTSGGFASPYGDRARQGATIVPRFLFFVNVEESSATVRAANTLTVSARRSKQEKAPWKQLGANELTNQTVESEHVIGVHLGETVAPYVLLAPLNAILPVSRSTGQILRDENGWYGVDPLSLGERMRRRWRLVSELWDEHKRVGNKLTLIENLDYMGKLSYQRSSKQDSPLRLLYATSGRATAAILNDRYATIDHTAYWISVNSHDEAIYLAAIINSSSVELAVAPLMPKGQFGSRHVHKHIWRLPIPEYDDSESLHVEIAQAGEDAAAGAQALWTDIRAEREAKGQSTSVTVARREIRKWLSESSEGQRVESLVGRLLGG